MERGGGGEDERGGTPGGHGSERATAIQTERLRELERRWGGEKGRDRQPCACVRMWVCVCVRACLCRCVGEVWRELLRLRSLVCVSPSCPICRLTIRVITLLDIHVYHTRANRMNLPAICSSVSRSGCKEIYRN